MAKKIINVVYKVDDKELNKAKTSIQGVEKETKDAEREMVKLDKSIQKTGNDASKSFGNFNKVLGAISFAAVGAAVFALGKRIFDLGVKQEQLNIAFNTFLGSAAKGKKLLQELTKFSIVTPFSPDQVNSAAKALLAFGVQGDQVIPTLKMLGDVSAGTGKDLSEMAVIFGQIRSTGRLMGQDLLQLINAGFNPLQVISEKTGKSMRFLKKEMEDGKISFEQVAGAFKTATSEGGLFFNLMEKQSASIGGVMSTISGNIDEGFKNIFTASSGPLKEFVDTLQTLSMAFLEFTKSREQLKEEEFQKVISTSVEQFKHYKEAFGDTGEAIKFYQKVLEARVERLKDEYKIQRDLADQSVDIISSIHGTTQAKEAEIAAAKKQEQVIGDQIDAYELDLIPNLEKYIIESELATEATKTDTEEQKKSTKELRNRAKALEAINKQLGFKTGAERFVEGQAEDDKKAKQQSDAIDREIEQNERRAKVLKDNDADMEAERVRIAEESAEERISIAEEEEARKQAAIDRTFQLAIQAATLALENALLTREIDTQSISEKYERELELAGDNDRAKEDIEKERDAKLRAAEKRNKEIQKRNARTKIAIDTAIAVVKTMSEFGYPAGLIPAALMVALGALQINKVNKYKKGGIAINGPGTGTSDSIPAMISRGESVITADATSRSRNLLEAINERRIDDRVLKQSSNDGGRQAKAFDDSRIIAALNKGIVQYEQHGYTLMKAAKTGKNFTRIIRAKVQGY